MLVDDVDEPVDPDAAEDAAVFDADVEDEQAEREERAKERAEGRESIAGVALWAVNAAAVVAILVMGWATVGMERAADAAVSHTGPAEVNYTAEEVLGVRR